jgi:HlyD family secretion protein
MATASEKIFREAALERLSSPEQLDRLIRLTSPIGWASTAVVAALLAAIIAWSIFGSVPTRVQGAGILIARGGQVFDAMAPAAGTLVSVAPIGTKVVKGDIVARLDDTQADQDIEHARNVLSEQQGQLQELTEHYAGEIAARSRVGAQQRDNLEAIIAAAEQRRDFYKQSLENERPVAAQGFLTQRFMLPNRREKVLNINGF